MRGKLLVIESLAGYMWVFGPMYLAVYLPIYLPIYLSMYPV
jgi:hypothetical protein